MRANVERNEYVEPIRLGLTAEQVADAKGGHRESILRCRNSDGPTSKTWEIWCRNPDLARQVNDRLLDPCLRI